MTIPDGMTLYAQASATALLEAIPFYEAIDCDFGVAANAFIRHTRNSSGVGDFQVRGMPFPASNFSGVHLILSPLVKDEGGRRTLAPLAAFLRANDITDMRVIGKGFMYRVHQYSRNHGRSWGTLKPEGAPPKSPPPTVVIDAPIPASPATEPDLPMEVNRT